MPSPKVRNDNLRIGSTELASEGYILSMGLKTGCEWGKGEKQEQTLDEMRELKNLKAPNLMCR